MAKARLLSCTLFAIIIIIRTILNGQRKSHFIYIDKEVFMMYACLVPHPPLIIPGIGTGHEIPDTRRSFEQIADKLAAYKPDTVVIISPHSILYSDYFHIAPGKGASGDFSTFGAEDIKYSVSYDKELAGLIGKLARKQGISAGSEGSRSPALDHGVMVPMYFLKPGKIVRISLSGFSLAEHYRFGMCINEAARMLSRKIAVVASGDMSHKLKEDGPYGFTVDGPRHDQFVYDCIKSQDFRRLMTIDTGLCERAAECGLRSLVMLLGALDGMNVVSRVLSYEGPYGVGYLTADFIGEGEATSLFPKIMEDRQRQLMQKRKYEDVYVRLARQNIESYVNTGSCIRMPEGLPSDMLLHRAGVFVSIKKDGQLRGCIGTMAPTQNHIAEEIIKNSVSAACYDPRFSPVAPEELDDLIYSVDVLSPAERIDSPDELDVRLYGVIVRCGHKNGLLLPNLDGVDTVEQQIDIAMRKAGIGADEPYTLERFKVVRHT